MKDLNFFALAVKQLQHNNAFSSEHAESRAVKEQFGISRDPGGNTRINNEEFQTSQVMALIKSAEEKSMSFVRAKAGCFNDPVNQVAAEQFGYSLNDILTAQHPLDQVFDLIRTGIDNSVKAAEKELSRKRSLNADEINGHYAEASSGSRSGSAEEPFRMISTIFSVMVPSGRSKLKLDPIDMENLAKFPAEPKHGLSEWQALLKDVFEIRAETFNEIMLKSGDPINDVAADIYGSERPSSIAIQAIDNEILKQTYKLNKLKATSKEYEKLKKEILKLKEDRSIRKANMEAADKYSKS